GIDHGTLEKRFNDAYRGSVVAKTGTLHSVSALAGVAYTRSRGPLIFVIFNHGGSPYSFRGDQDETIKKVITLCGGLAPHLLRSIYPFDVVQASSLSLGFGNYLRWCHREPPAYSQQTVITKP